MFVLCHRRINDSHVNGTNGLSDDLISMTIGSSQDYDGVASNAHKNRSVSMFEPRDGSHTLKPTQTHENRSTNSMYQMVDGHQVNERSKADEARSPVNGSAPPNILPRSEDVKYHTEIVTRRIQELWSVMQELSSAAVFIPGAERVALAVADLTALFSMVSVRSFAFCYSLSLPLSVVHLPARF